MTERMTAKRFELFDVDLYEYGMSLNEILDNGIPLSQNQVCRLLNDLHEENEQLRHDATILIQSNQDYRKENEELKQQLKELKEDVPLLLAFYRWYPFAVEKKEHQAYNRLWDFVND